MEGFKGLYTDFCFISIAFNIPDLEKKPTQQVVRPPEGALGRVCYFIKGLKPMLGLKPSPLLLEKVMSMLKPIPHF